jgi:hypothetical protein
MDYHGFFLAFMLILCTCHLLFSMTLLEDPLANAPLDLKVKSLERYLGADLVAFRIREAKAELFAAKSLEEKREWKADPTTEVRQEDQSQSLLQASTDVGSNFDMTKGTCFCSEEITKIESSLRSELSQKFEELSLSMLKKPADEIKKLHERSFLQSSPIEAPTTSPTIAPTSLPVGSTIGLRLCPSRLTFGDWLDAPALFVLCQDKSTIVIKANTTTIEGNVNIVGTSAFTSSQPSTSTSTGALIVTGGVGVGGDLNVGGNININGISVTNQLANLPFVLNGGLHFNILATPYVYEASFTGRTMKSFPIWGVAGVPYNAKLVWADVFFTCNAADHQTVNLGATRASFYTLFLNSRGSQPSSQFSSNYAAPLVSRNVYNGDLDGYSPYYGQWFPSQQIPVTDGSITWDNQGANLINNLTNTGWIYVYIQGFWAPYGIPVSMTSTAANTLFYTALAPLQFTQLSLPRNGSVYNRNFGGAFGIPSYAQAILADVYVKTNISDHQVVTFGKAHSSQFCSVVARGQQPSAQFSATCATTMVTRCVYHGEADAYSPMYGEWYSSTIIPLEAGVMHWAAHNNSGSTGYAMLHIKGYYSSKTTANYSPGTDLLTYYLPTSFVYERQYTMSGAWDVASPVSQPMRNTNGVPSGAKFLVADVFVTIGASDHCVICIGQNHSVIDMFGYSATYRSRLGFYMNLISCFS